MKYHIKIFSLTFFLLSLILLGCERNKKVCPENYEVIKNPIHLDDLLSATPVPQTRNTPITVEINGKKIEVDKLVDYPLCNDDWRGIVYVGCEAQIAEVENDPNENPLFFRGCDLDIEPGTVVYVAAHNDTPYYKGCSCHTGENPE
jgi:hypothetical protein